MFDDQIRSHRYPARPATTTTTHYRQPIAIGLLLAMALLGCSGEADQPVNGGHGKGAGPGGQRHQQPPVPVAVARATTGTIASHYAATATLAADKEAEILARVAGVAGTLRCEEGDLVKQGSILLHIDNQEYALRLDQAEANTANLTARHTRLQGMLVKELVSAEDFEQVKADLKSAHAEEGLARLTLSYTRVTAPFAGRIVSRLVDVGQNVSVGTPLFILADFDPLLARVHVPSREFKQLKVDQTVELVLDSTSERLAGRIKLVSPTIDPTSGTIKITVEIKDYPAHTRPGDFAEVRIVTERRTDTTLVPKTAVVTDRGDQVVYVAADSTAERRVVEVGFEDDLHAEILSGITAGEELVIKGQRTLKHGSRIKVIEGRAGAAADPAAIGGPAPHQRPGGGRPDGRPARAHAPGTRRGDGHPPGQDRAGRRRPGAPQPGDQPPGESPPDTPPTDAQPAGEQPADDKQTDSQQSDQAGS